MVVKFHQNKTARLRTVLLLEDVSRNTSGKKPIERFLILRTRIRFYSCESNTDFGYISTFVEMDSRKEVIHPQLPLRMPCYDLTLIIDPAFVPLLGAFGHCQLSWFDGR